MRRSLFVLLFSIFYIASSFSLHAESKTFHRLVAVNEKSELLIVKIKDRPLWVTPGWYQDELTTPGQAMQKQLDDYGLAIKSNQLRGVFTLVMGKPSAISTRLVHIVDVTIMSKQLPEGIEEVRWLPLQEALSLVSLEHIRYQLEQIFTHPDTVWGGVQEMYWQDGTNHFSVLEPFYPLFTVEKHK